jgi:hypothetical protein
MESKVIKAPEIETVIEWLRSGGEYHAHYMICQELRAKLPNLSEFMCNMIAKNRIELAKEKIAVSE